MTDERREAPRVAAAGPCSILDADGAERPFELVDLSESGARLRCETPIGAMTRVQVMLILPGERVGRAEDARIRTDGVVVWSHRGDDGAYDTGVFFPELDDESAVLLQAYVLSAV